MGNGSTPARRTRRARLLLLLAAPLLFSSCRDNSPLAPGLGAGGRTQFGTGDVRLSLAASAGPQAGELTYTLRLLAPGEDVSAYQGELRFAPGALEVISLQGGERAEGESQVLNLDRATGAIRFAAYALDGFDGDEVLRLVVRRRADAAPKFDAWLEVVGDTEGHTLTAVPGRYAAGPSYMLFPNSVGPAFLGLLAGSVASQQLLPGTKLTLPVIADLTAAGSLSLARLRTRVTWDPARMTFDSVRANQALGWTFTSNTAGAGTGSITFTGAGTALAATSTIATAYFTTSAGSGGTLVKVLPDSAANAQAVSVLPDLRPRALSLCVAAGSGLWGDANDDGAVNIIDAQQLARHGVGLSVLNPTAVQNRGDVTADGSVNIIDSQQVARFSVGLSAAARTNTPQFTPPAIGSISLSPSGSQSVLASGSLQLDATARDGTGADQTGCATLSWSSTNNGVATVNASGLVSAVAPGTATITAASGTANASVQVTVTALATAVPHAVVAGMYHSCDLDASGHAWCWGGNEYGQLGDGSFIDRAQPVAVAGGHTFTSLTANRKHTCGLRTDGTAWCWGSAEFGVLGNGSSSGKQNSPVQVSGGLQFAQLAAGQDHTCGLTTSGSAYCWGRNLYGEVGDGTQSLRSIPAAVKGGLTYTDISAGLHHACALRPAGAAYCWGDNRAGQVGDGTKANALVPTPVTGDYVWRRITAGAYTSCGLTASGQAFCWGSNGDGQVGDGTIGTDRTAPAAVATGVSFASIYAGDTSCGLTAAGAAWCWGLNGQGQIGDGTRQGRSSPVAVGGGVVFAELDPQAYLELGSQVSLAAHTCGRATGGATYCWGSNTHGQLGAGVTTTRSSPVAVSGTFGQIDAAGEVTCATTSGPGAAYCWGANNFGALGDGTTTARTVPTALAGSPSFTLIATGGLHGCGVTAGGAASCWGQNQYGQVGDSTTVERWSPAAVKDTVNFSSVSVGFWHSCGLEANGHAWCWGNNQFGQLGDSSTVSRTAPVPVKGALSFTAISVGSEHTCGLVAGAAYCWGRNNSGALGRGTTADTVKPALVAGGRTFAQLSAGDGYTCAVEAVTGAVWCWGSNGSGQLGDGTTAGHTSPTAVSGGLALAQVSAGSGLTCGWNAAGAAWCWGGNGLGQLGGGTRTESLVTSPQALAGSIAFGSITAATNHACGLAAGGTVYCWGSNASGQLGTGTGSGVITAPQPVTPH